MYALSSRHFANLIQIRMFVCTYICTHVRTSVLHAAHVAEMYLCMYVRMRYVCLPHIWWTLPHGLDTTHIRTFTYNWGSTVTLCVRTSYTTLYYIFTS